MPVTPEDYLAAAVAHLRPARLDTESVPLFDALGRTLANDAVARLSVPPFDNSAMDGFAVRVEDFVGEGPWVFSVVAEIAAGSVGQNSAHDACSAHDAAPALPQAARIMTGAPVPAWADAVVKVEDTDAPAGASELPDTVTIHAAPQPGQNIRRAGEDLVAGALALPSGAVLGARSLSALASVGFGEVEVVRRPRVAVIATGSELAAPGEALGPGMIPDSNSALISGLVREAGGEPVVVRTVADTADAFGQALVSADTLGARPDLIVTSGGVSMGAFDPVKEYGLTRGWTFEKVAMQPGKPQGHGLSPAGVPVMCLPGNPVSVAVSFRLFVRPLLALLLGQPHDAARRLLPAGAAWKSPAGRRQYVAAKVVREGAVVPVHELGSGSHLVASLHYAEVLAVVPADKEEVHPGDLLDVLTL
ncbi:molybdopterin molybdotransferase MoeA [Trueperella pyogenes]